MSKKAPASPKEIRRNRLVQAIKATLKKLHNGEFAISELITALNEALSKIKGKVGRLIKVIDSASNTKVQLRVLAADPCGKWIGYGITVNAPR